MNISEANIESSPSIDVLMKIIRELVEELHPKWPKKRKILPKSLLTQELGLDSLARVELLARIERHLNITLPEEIFITAETADDLWQAMTDGGRSFAPAAYEDEPAEDIREAPDLPLDSGTLLDVLEWHIERHPDRHHLSLYGDKDEIEVLTYGQLGEGARAVAAGLQARGLLPGDPVSIMLPTSREYFFTFLGILLAGGIPVPIYPPFRMNQLEDHMRRHSAILRSCKAKMMVTVPEAKPFAHVLKAQVESMDTLATVQELTADRFPYRTYVPAGNDIAFLQYTSGSTGNPKGVMLTHANLLANIRALGEVVKVRSTDVIVSWLPLYHDMGLIGTWLSSVYYAALLVVMSPLSFIARPQRWLMALSHHRGTISAAPNFAYELCLKRITDEDMKGIDLSAWRIACNGAEPVSPDTIEGFCTRFAPYGFRRETMMPVYGLAECSVGLAFPPLGRAPVIDRIDRDTFVNFGHAVSSDEADERILKFVACGRPLPGHEVRIVDGNDREVPELHEGMLHFRGPSATAGYYANDEDTRSLFHGDWLDSGDMAYIRSGDIYITGRKKDIIIRAGRNIYPQELEEAAGNVEGIRKGNVAVFATLDRSNSTEKLVVMAETREEDPEKLNLLRERINSLAMELVGTAADDVALVPPGTVLKTSSGKIRRAASRNFYESGSISAKTRPAWRQVLHIAVSGVLPEFRRLAHNIFNSVYAVYCLVLFGLLAPVVWLSVMSLPGLDRRWTVMRKAARFLAKATFTPIEVRGMEDLAGIGSCVLVSNHASYLDNFIMVAMLPLKFSFVAKGELKKYWFSRTFLERIEAEFVDRDDRQKSLEDARRFTLTARVGRNLLFYPEGTFTRIPGLRPFFLGAFKVSAETGLPVVPIAISGTRSKLRDVSLFTHRGGISITIGKPIDPHRLQEAGAPDLWATAIKMHDAARVHILKYCGEPDLSHF